LRRRAQCWHRLLLQPGAKSILHQIKEDKYNFRKIQIFLH